MMLSRRAFVAASILPLLVPKLAFAADEQANPLLYRVRRGKGTAYLLGVFEAKDDGWFVPKIATALDAADVLWLETPPGSTTAAAEGQQAAPDPELQRIFTEQGFDREHDLCGTLPAKLSRRTLDWAQRLQLPREELAPMRPWFARITLQQAFASRRQAAAASDEKLVSPERIVLDRARRRGTAIESEYATLADLIRFFAGLRGPAQPQYLEELLDYFDRDAAGENDTGKYGWITGHPDPRSLDEQRERTPDLYRAMHIERNAWWTGRIEGLLADGRTAFILIGMNHTLGPDSIQANLARRGLTVETL
jgi:uncharacterized protein YbaP (TraB family)